MEEHHSKLRDEKSQKYQRLERWLAAALILIVAWIAWVWYALGNDAEANINSYDECVAAGNPVAESFPEQCFTDDGRSFTRDTEQNEVPQEENSTQYTSEKGIVLTVDTPIKNSTISSPLNIAGRVPGNWSFEASFPVRLVDEEGKVLAEGIAHLNGDWMTEDLVPFTAELKFDKPASGEGKLILMKDNPSGLAENDDSLSIPVVFD